MIQVDRVGCGLRVAYPPPTRREPPFDGGPCRVWGLVGRNLAGKRLRVALIYPLPLGGVRDEMVPLPLTGARRETAGQRVETSTLCIGITPVLFVGVAGYDGHAHA